MNSAQIRQGLKATGVTGLSTGIPYLLIQNGRALDPSPVKDVWNQSAANVAATMAFATSLKSTIDALVLLVDHYNEDYMTSKRLGLLCFGILFSLATMIYAGINFSDQRHTGVVALMATANTAFNFWAQSSFKQKERVKEIEKHTPSALDRAARPTTGGAV